MTNINLLPWREELREERKKQFIAMLATSVVSAILLMVLVHFIVSSKISAQDKRNRYLKNEIVQFDKEIKKIEALKKMKAMLVARMEIIQELQSNRPQIVHLFDQVVRVLPEGVHLSQIMRNGDRLTLIGKAESNTNVSDLMRNISSSAWLKQPSLHEIKNNKRDGLLHSEFRLQLQMTHPLKSATKETQNVQS